MTTSTETAGAGADAAAAAAAAAAGGKGSTAEPSAPWYADPALNIQDEDKAWYENKGWKDANPVHVLLKSTKSYRDLEKVMRNKEHAVLLPKMDDPQAVGEFFTRLGKPEAADKYALPAEWSDEQKAGMNADLLKTYQGIAHKAHMTQAQWATFLGEHEKTVAAAEEAKVMAYNGQVAAVKQKLADEYGDNYGEQVARGNLAMQKLGISKDDMGDIGEALGVERATRMLMSIGEMLAQHKAVGLTGDSKPDGFVTDQARARAEIQAVKLGQKADFRKALVDPSHPEHKNVNNQWREWNRVANAKGAA